MKFVGLKNRILNKVSSNHGTKMNESKGTDGKPGFEMFEQNRVSNNGKLTRDVALFDGSKRIGGGRTESDLFVGRDGDLKVGVPSPVSMRNKSVGETVEYPLEMESENNSHISEMKNMITNQDRTLSESGSDSMDEVIMRLRQSGLLKTGHLQLTADGNLSIPENIHQQEDINLHMNISSELAGVGETYRSQADEMITNAREEEQNVIEEIRQQEMTRGNEMGNQSVANAASILFRKQQQVQGEMDNIASAAGMDIASSQKKRG